MFTQKVIGYTRVANNLRAAAAASENTGRITMAWARETRRVLKGTPYPPRLPFQRYVRTGRLANSWRVVGSGKNGASIQNNATGPAGQVYPVYVIGDAQGKSQAGIHKNRWWIARNVIEGQVPKLNTALLDDITDKGNG